MNEYSQIFKNHACALCCTNSRIRVLCLSSGRQQWKAQSNLFARKFLASGKGAIETDNGWVFHPMFERYQKDFIDWSNHDTLCEWLIEYTNGKLKLWLTEVNQTGCHLTFFEESTNIPVGAQSNSPVAE